MIFKEPLEDVVRRRRSVRTYIEKPVTQDIRQEINDYISTLTSPFPAKPVFRQIDIKAEPNGMKLGTYGMIKGATFFIGAAVNDKPFAVEALGYEFEKLILFLTTLDLGTCWLGGTFNRDEFKKVMATDAGMLFPAVSPVGYFEKKSFRESLVRRFIKADARLPWDTLFFDGGFGTPLTASAAGVFEYPLEMVRLGPSASNKQPWRLVKTGDRIHFYESKTPAYSSAFPFDMQSIDMGIAACHFELAAAEKGIPGSFLLEEDPRLNSPENMLYKFTWSAQ